MAPQAGSASFHHLPIEMLRSISEYTDYRYLSAYAMTCKSTAEVFSRGEVGMRTLCSRAAEHFGGEAALFRACSSCNVLAVQILVQLHGARPSKACMVALATANSQDVLAQLLDSGASVMSKSDCPALYAACQHGHLQLVSFLLQRLREVAPPESVTWSVHCGLSRAAMGNCMEVARFLLAEGAHPRALTCGALWQAAKNGNIALCQLLLEHGADVHDMSDAALRIAATNGHLDAVQLLLDAGADLHAADSGALVEAAAAGQAAMCELLLTHGADLTARNGQVLASAAESGSQDIVLVLLRAMRGLRDVDGHVAAASERIGPRINLSMLRLLQLPCVNASQAEMCAVAEAPQGPVRDAMVSMRRRVQILPSSPLPLPSCQTLAS